MELCEADILHTSPQNRKRRILKRVNMLLWVQVVAAVRHLHTHRWLHRDIKPGNCFVQAISGRFSNQVPHRTAQHFCSSGHRKNVLLLFSDSRG